MSRVQLGLPLSVVSRLSDDEKSKLISQQCTLLQIDDFETDSLLNMCADKGKISKGFGLVYRFAGLVDEIRDTLSEFIQILSSRSSPNTLSGSKLALGTFHNNLYLVMLKLVYLLSNWRRMQWVPRPILFDADGILITFSMFFEKACKYFTHLLVDQQSANQTYTNSDDLAGNIKALLQLIRSQELDDIEMEINNVVEWFLEIMAIEGLIETKWQDVLNGTLVYPWLTILCLPYADIEQNGEMNKWFAKSFKRYTQISKKVEDLFLPILEHAHMAGTMDDLSDSLLCLRDVIKLQQYFKRSQSRSIAYLSAKNQFQLGSVCPMIFRSTWVSFILSGLHHFESSSKANQLNSFNRGTYSHVSQPMVNGSPGVSGTQSANTKDHDSHDRQLYISTDIQDNHLPPSSSVIPQQSITPHSTPLIIQLSASEITSESLPKVNNVRSTSTEDAVVPNVSNALEVSGAVDLSASSASGVKARPAVAPIDTSIFTETKHVKPQFSLANERTDDLPSSAHSGDDGDATAAKVSVAEQAPISSSTQRLFSPLPSESNVKEQIVDPDVIELSRSAPSVTEMKPSVVPQSQIAEEKAQIEVLSRKISPTTSSDPISNPPNGEEAVNHTDKTDTPPLSVSAAGSITSPIVYNADIIGNRTQKSNNKKTMIIKQVMSEDGDDDDGEVIYLVRYDPSRHNSPDHTIINQIEQMHQAKKNHSSSFSTPTNEERRHNHNNNNRNDEFDNMYRPRMSSDPSHSHSQQHPVFLAQHRRSSPTTSFRSNEFVRDSLSPAFDRRSKTVVQPSPSSFTLDRAANTMSHRNWSAKQRLRGIDFSAQSLSSALRQIDEDNRVISPIEEPRPDAKPVSMEERRAARKIATWYMLVAPRRKLLRRLLLRDMMISIVQNIVDLSLQEITIRKRRRLKMLRHGAAVKIQRQFRKWRTVLVREIKQREIEERRESAWEYLEVWRRAVMNGIRLFRYFRHVVRRKLSGAKNVTPTVSVPTSPSNGKSPNQSTDDGSVSTVGSSDERESKDKRKARIKKFRVSIMQNFVISPSTGHRVAIADVIEMYVNEFAFYQKFGTIRRTSAPPVPIIHRQISSRKLSDIMYNSDAKALHMKSYDTYALRIQLAYRTYRARLDVWEKRVERASVRRIILFLIRCTARRRRIRAETRRVASTKISKWFLGIRARLRLYEEVRSGLLLKLAWINYMHYKKLKSQLRRVDRPITILLHGLRNITKQTLVTDEIRIVVSVWWNPILHIVGESDAEQMIQSKPPQYIYRSQPHRVTTEDDKPVLELAQNRRTIGTMVQRASDMMNFIRPTQNLLRSRLSSSGSSIEQPAAEGAATENNNNSNNNNNNNNNNGNNHRIGNSQNNNQRKASTGGSSSSNVPVTSDQDRPMHRNRRSANILNTADAPPTSATAFVRKTSGGKSNLAIAAAVGAAANRQRTGSASSQDSGDREKALSGIAKVPPPPSSGANSLPNSNPPQFNPKAATLLANRIRERKLRSASHDTAANEENGTSGSSALGVGGDALAALAMRRSRTTSSGADSVGAGTSGQEGGGGGDDGSRANHTIEEEDDTSTGENRSGTSGGLHSPVPTKVTTQNVMRNTLAFAFGLSAMAKKSNIRKKSKVVCNFEDETIRIPGCHGNSVMKFEVFDGDRIIGKYVFSMRKEGALMYWGGEYQRPLVMTYTRRGVQLNSRIQLKKGAEHHVHGQGSKNAADGMPVLDFRVIAGPPLRSRCQWGRVMVRGNGPLQRQLRSREGFFHASTLNIFDHWERFYFSLDDVGLHLFENKFDQIPVATVLAREFKSVSVDMGSSEEGEEQSWQISNRIMKTLMAQSPVNGRGTSLVTAVGNKFVEDIFNVILITTSGDEMNLRYLYIA